MAQWAIVSPSNFRSRDLVGSAEPDAIGLGRVLGSDGVGPKLRYGGERHVLVFGPNGSGKGMRLLVPNLLQLQNRSIFVIDPKGELAALTAPFRRQIGEVVIINPFGVLCDVPGYGDMLSVGFNPMLTIDPESPTFNRDAGLLADALIKTESQREPHFDDSARALVAMLIMHVAIEARRVRRAPTLTRVRELLCQRSAPPSEENLWRGDGLPAIALSIMEEAEKNASAPGRRGLHNKASQFTDWNKEIQSIASTAKRQTEFLDDDEMVEDLGKPGFDFRVMKQRPVTVYLVLPPDLMIRHARWLRLALATALNACLRPRLPGEPKVLFMLDEFAALGHLKIIETVWALVRGYGVQIMPVLQDLNQLKGIYRDRWETFVGMAGAMLSFGPNDSTTAEWLSKRAGDTTRVVASYNSSSGTTQNGTSQNSGLNWSQMKYPLLPAHKLYGLSSGTTIVTLAGLSNVIAGYAPGYWEIAQCVERAPRSNPFFVG